MKLKILNINTAWCSPKSKDKAHEEYYKIIETYDPDLICFTEVRKDFLKQYENTIYSNPDYGYEIIDNKRKVALWSKHPFKNIDEAKSKELPGGRYLSANLEYGNESIEIIGVCIPWQSAHVSTGRKDRTLWQDHEQYLKGLKTILKNKKENTIVLGDFNQRIPHERTPQKYYDILLNSFVDFNIITKGELNEAGDKVIDHIAVSKDINTVDVQVISRYQNDIAISDHDFVFAEIE